MANINVKEYNFNRRGKKPYLFSTHIKFNDDGDLYGQVKRLYKNNSKMIMSKENAQTFDEHTLYHVFRTETDIDVYGNKHVSKYSVMIFKRDDVLYEFDFWQLIKHIEMFHVMMSDNIKIYDIVDAVNL